MTTKETGNFFGLFGCEEQSTKKSGRHVSEEDLEDGEIAEHSETSLADGAHFDTLVSTFQQEESQKLTFKGTKKCVICTNLSTKYTCPKCGMKTCSLNCCLLHKKNFNCDGVRDRLSFVPLKSYSEVNFHSDCQFLDEASEAVNNSSRAAHNSNTSKDVSNWTTRFIQEAMRRQIHYKKMPSSFKKAKLNKSMYVYKEKLISWDVEFVLPFCLVNCVSNYETTSSSEAFHSITFKKSRISERRILSEVINDVINSNDPLPEAMQPASMAAYTTAAAQGDVIALFRHDSGKFHYILDASKTLLDNFAHKTIVEYPTIVIILRRYISHFVIQNEAS